MQQAWKFTLARFGLYSGHHQNMVYGILKEKLHKSLSVHMGKDLCNESNLIHHLSSVYSVTIPLDVSGSQFDHHFKLFIPLCYKNLNVYQLLCIIKPSSTTWRDVSTLKFKWRQHVSTILSHLQALHKHLCKWLTLWRQNFLLNFSTPVFKMWIIQEPNNVALWNKWLLKRKKQRLCGMFKIFSTDICWINI
jgi:hypothetical protein